MHFSPRVCLTKGRPTFPRVSLEFHIVKMFLINVCFPHKITQNCNETRRFLHTLDSILKGKIKVKVPFQDTKVRFLCCYKHLLAWKKSTVDDSEILHPVRCINILLIVRINYDKLIDMDTLPIVPGFFASRWPDDTSLSQPTRHAAAEQTEAGGVESSACSASSTCE